MNQLSKIVFIIAGIFAGLAALVWLALHIKPASFPAFAQTSVAPETIGPGAIPIPAPMKVAGTGTPERARLRGRSRRHVSAPPYARALAERVSRNPNRPPPETSPAPLTTGARAAASPRRVPRRVPRDERGTISRDQRGPVHLVPSR